MSSKILAKDSALLLMLSWMRKDVEMAIDKKLYTMDEVLDALEPRKEDENWYNGWYSNPLLPNPKTGLDSFQTISRRCREIAERLSK